jgi:DNA replication and repair protein RecF
MIPHIRLKDFRSYKEASFEFLPGVNIIVGPNASGKTNLLEAILVLARGSSYRASDVDLIRLGRPWSRIASSLESGEERALKIERGPSGSLKTYLLNGKAYKRLSLQRQLPCILFEPNHLQLLGGQPELRRQYLDDLLEQTNPAFGPTRRHYKRVLAQRNALLKNSSRSFEKQLFVWNIRLSELGGFIARERLKLVEELNQYLPKLYKDMSHSKTLVTADYHSSMPAHAYETALLRKLENSFAEDRLRGFTSVGPHRDDLVINFNGSSSAKAASRGETRTVVLALKIFELSRLETAREQKPLLLLDDVFSELDGRRRHALTDYLKEYQTFITTTDADVVIQTFAQSTNLIALD